MPRRRPKDPAPAPNFDWTPYYRAVARIPARDTALFALEKFADEPKPSEPRLVIDLGCGNGTDAREFLRRGWRVLGIDMNAAPLAELRRRTTARRRERLETRVARLESLRRLPRADLVNASCALPFCRPAAFPRLWEIIRAAIPIGGRFAGNFFGRRDDWAVARHMTFHRRSDLRALFAGFDLEFLRETDSDSKTALGHLKHWHRFEIVARRWR